MGNQVHRDSSDDDDLEHHHPFFHDYWDSDMEEDDSDSDDSSMSEGEGLTWQSLMLVRSFNVTKLRKLLHVNGITLTEKKKSAVLTAYLNLLEQYESPQDKLNSDILDIGFFAFE